MVEVPGDPAEVEALRAPLLEKLNYALEHCEQLHAIEIAILENLKQRLTEFPRSWCYGCVRLIQRLHEKVTHEPTSAV